MFYWIICSRTQMFFTCRITHTLSSNRHFVPRNPSFFHFIKFFNFTHKLDIKIPLQIRQLQNMIACRNILVKYYFGMKYLIYIKYLWFHEVCMVLVIKYSWGAGVISLTKLNGLLGLLLTERQLSDKIRERTFTYSKQNCPFSEKGRTTRALAAFKFQVE